MVHPLGRFLVIACAEKALSSTTSLDLQWHAVDLHLLLAVLILRPQVSRRHVSHDEDALEGSPMFGIRCAGSFRFAHPVGRNDHGGPFRSFRALDSSHGRSETELV
jgi:hypothetical protein